MKNVAIGGHHESAAHIRVDGNTASPFGGLPCRLRGVVFGKLCADAAYVLFESHGPRSIRPPLPALPESRDEGAALIGVHRPFVRVEKTTQSRWACGKSLPVIFYGLYFPGVPAPPSIVL